MAFRSRSSPRAFRKEGSFRIFDDGIDVKQEAARAGEAILTPKADKREGGGLHWAEWKGTRGGRLGLDYQRMLANVSKACTRAGRFVSRILALRQKRGAK